MTAAGESDTGVSCVKFGMLADENDMADLVSMVAQRGKWIEESSQVGAADSISPPIDRVQLGCE